MERYFLVSVSTRAHLDLCLRYALAGFTDSANGFWTYLEIEEGDFLSFLYGAKVWNLYRVRRKVCLRNAQGLPPWPPVTFRGSGKTYHFPFRLELEPVRELEESLVRWEFAYVAENLLLRGGYGKTHFQADRTTLQSVSALGSPTTEAPERLTLPREEEYIPVLVASRKQERPPDSYAFNELMLQALIKRHLRDQRILGRFLGDVGLESLDPAGVEVLGERGLPEGFVDVLIKEAFPAGRGTFIVLEVKKERATPQDIEQVARYAELIGPESRGAAIVARRFSPSSVAVARDLDVAAFTYRLGRPLDEEPATFDQLLESFTIARVGAGGSSLR